MNINIQPLRYCFFLLLLSAISCQDDPVETIDTESIFGNWRVVKEVDKVYQVTREGDDGITTTWNGLTYIGSIKITETGSVKINSFDHSYANGIEGTWTLHQDQSHITFAIQSFTKEFSIRRENDLLVFESPTHIIYHRLIP